MTNDIPNPSGFDNLLKTLIKQRMTAQAKSALFIFEDLLKNGWIKEEDFRIYRKQILDSHGENNRQIETFIDMLDISLKK